LYTQCPDCGTVFRVTADVLRVAQGAVRCGICSTRFNALESLRDEPRALLAGQPPEDTITVEELPGNEMIELSTPEAETEIAPAAESATGEGSGAAVDEPHEAPLAQSEDGPQDSESSDEPAPDALEFHGSAEDLERVFILAGAETAAGRGENAPNAELGDEAGDERLLEAFERASLADLSGIEVHEERTDIAPAAGRDDLDRTDEFPILVLHEAASRETPDVETPVIRPVEDESPPEQAAAEAAGTAGRDAEPEPAGEPRFLIPEELRRDLAAGPASRREGALSLEARDALGLPPPDLEEDAARRWPWVVGATLLVVALAMQAVHYWRDDLVRHPLAGPWVLRAYQSLGLPLDPPADLAAFELRQWGATSDATQPGRLRLRASIVNRAAFAQPYPLLRLSLQDRFGNTVGVRDVEAADYLPGGAATTARLLGPGQRADAEIVFVDPGRDAVGYELDLCLPAGDGVRCANPAAANR
jgi:predicted Zn finger-like uncharacterized protein